MGMKDSDIAATARNEARMVLTFDLDFGEVIFRRGREAWGNRVQSTRFQRRGASSICGREPGATVSNYRARSITARRIPLILVE